MERDLEYYERIDALMDIDFDFYKALDKPKPVPAQKVNEGFGLMIHWLVPR